MKNWIIKSNEWFDNLPEPKRSFIFLLGCGITLLGVMIGLIIYNFMWGLPIWVVLFLGWRIPYFIIKEKDKYERL